ncbi:MAG: hypothetical protein QOD00_1932 [Blastocatellia bacterium]|jgi:hypothetical protein|nr:hypothetical protein [Blastocatellia bacterium]
MPPSIFISYSRQEAPFVDSLLDHLEDNNMRVWVDYHSLIPARPWADEIARGIEEADVVLLVVSKASMRSDYAVAELLTAFQLKKRIILIIFEAVKLPEDFESYEWIDFRGSFKKGLNRLLTQLERPVAMKHGPPQKGFKAPPVVWVCFIISLLLSVCALPALWTFYPPYYLVPLPYRILKRDFSYSHVRSALIMLVFASFLTVGLMRFHPRLVGISVLSFFLSPLLFFLLSRSSQMRRWGKPVASRPQFANPYHPQIERPRPVRFTVEAAPEDGKFAEALINGMAKYHHPYVEDAREAEVIFVLISRFNKAAVNDPEKRIVYPIILQSVKDIDVKLQRIQWIDFRRGLGNLDALAQLLPEPGRLFQALGISPMGDQVVLPRIINVLRTYLLALGAFNIGCWGVTILELGSFVSHGESTLIVVQLVLFLLTINWTLPSLTNREGRISSLRNLILTFIWLFVLSQIEIITFGWLVIKTHARGLPKDVIIFGGFAPLAYIAGLLIILPMAVWYRKDLWRWLPRQQSKTYNLPMPQG